MAINEREGLFSPCSEWIWLFEAPECNCYGQFSEKLPAGAGAWGRVKLHISAGRPVCGFCERAVYSVGPICRFPGLQGCADADITPFLNRGENLLEIRVWYPGRDSSVCRREPPGLWFEIRQGNVLYAAAAEAAGQGSFRAIYRGEVENITPQLGMTFRCHTPEPMCCGERRLLSKGGPIG